MHMSIKIEKLRSELLKLFEEYSKNNHTLVFTRLVKLLEELFSRDGIPKKQYEYIKKTMNIL